MAIWPFIISRVPFQELGEKAVRHEKIHFRQQLELLIFPFYLWYSVEYFSRLISTGNRHQAYRSICFEKEAYANERNENYLKERRAFSWIFYLKKSAAEDSAKV
jgi:hypothetical protein